MIENYTRLSSRMFTATVVGKDKNGRKITEGRETYKTPSGVYEIKDWARLGSLKKQPKPTACSRCWNK